MLSTTIKRTIATGLSGAAIAGTLGAPAASAMPIDPLRAPGQPGDTQIVAPTPPSAPAAIETAPDTGFDLSSAAISRYDDLEANKAKSMQALGLAMMQQSFASPYRDVEANKARTPQAR